MELFFNDIIIDKKKLIDASSITIPSTGICLLSGPNGSGKTLLGKSIMFHPMNKEIHLVTVDQNNDMIADNVSILHNITMTCNSNTNALVIAQLEKWGFAYLLNRNSKHLSGGEKRLINILRGLFSNAQVVIIDEPTNDLDYSLVEKLIWVLSEISTTHALLIISHDDRLRNIATKEYHLEAGLLKSYKDDTLSAMQEPAQFTNKNKNQRIIDMLIPSHYVPAIIIMALLGYIFFLYGIEFKETQVVESAVYDNEIIAYIPTSMSLHLAGAFAAYPSIVLQAGETTSAIEQIKVLRQIRENNHRFTYAIEGLASIQSCEQFDVYPIEYYIPENKITLNLLYAYLEYKRNSTSRDIFLCTEPFFVLPDFEINDERNNSYIFNPKEYMCFVDEYSIEAHLEGKAYTSAVVIVMKSGYNNELFYKSEVFKSFQKNNIYISSKEAASSMRELNDIKSVISLVPRIVVVLFVFSIINSLETWLFMQTNKKVFYILKNYSYTDVEVWQSLKRRSCPRAIPLVLFCLFIGVMVGLYFKEASFVNLLFVFLLTAYVLSATYSIERKIEKAILSKYYMWSSR